MNEAGFRSFMPRALVLGRAAADAGEAARHDLPAIFRAGGKDAQRHRAGRQFAVDHGGRGTFCPVFESGLSTYSLHQISRLSYVRRPGIARLMNNSG